MRRILYLIVVIFAFSTIIVAQTTVPQGTVKGKIIDYSSKESIPSATIRLLRESDSLLVKGATSAVDGSFTIIAKPGNYISHITFVGYEDVYKNVHLSKDTLLINLDTIYLAESSIMLDELIITSNPPEIVVKNDTLEYDADNYTVPQTAVLEDLLRNMSGLEIDTEGKITINGKEIKRILVNGKEFFSNDPKIASKNLPAKMFDKIQVLDKKSEMEKSTGFDDGEENMVINLTVKPDKKESIFGNAFTGYGSKDRSETNLMANYIRNEDQMTGVGGFNNTNNMGFSDMSGGGGGRGGRGGGGGGNSGVGTSGNAGLNFNKLFSKKLEIGGNLRYDSNDREVTSKTYTQNLLKKGNTFEDEADQSFNSGQNFNFDIRFEWKPDSLTNIVFRPSASFNSNSYNSSGSFMTTRESGDTINFGDSDYSSSGNGRDFGTTLNSNRRFAKKGRNIGLDFNIRKNESDNNAMNLSNTYYLGKKTDDIIDQRIKNTNNGRNWNINLSYVEPLGEETFLQFSYNYRSNVSNSDKDTRTKDENGDYTVLDKRYSKTNENDVDNQDYAINFRTRKEKYNYSIGFNAYPNNSVRKTYIGDSLISDLTQNVINYSPNAQFNYIWSRQINFRFNYRGSTNQPSMNQISPVIDISNPLNISYGNPDLKPAFTHFADARFQYSQPENKRFYMISTSFNYISNDIISSRFTDQETGRKENTFKNVNGNWNGDVRFNTTQPLRNKKFTINSNSYVSYRENIGYSNNEENLNKQTNLSENLGFNYNSTKMRFSLRGNISYNKVKNSLEGQQDREYFNYGSSADVMAYLPLDFSIQSDLRYSTNSGYSDGFKQNEMLWNASIEKLIFKKKNGVLRFKIYDILQQRSNIRRNITSNFIRDITTNTLNSYFILHFVYRFTYFTGKGVNSENMNDRGRGRGRRDVNNDYD
ncbi:MAG: outer membrane beta-barrel protein [Dysgonamonadaceae bacterium]